nr:LuxR family transcriptional regulator [uncultured Actinoplanes sp.]
MIGRESELARLRAAAAGVREAGSAWVVVGSPGLGKTALIRTITDELTARGFGALLSSGSAGHADQGFAVLHELLHPLLGNVDALPARQRSALLAAFGMADGAHHDRLLIHLAALGLLEDAAGAGRLLVVVDDAHRADPSSLEALIFVARRLSRSPLLLICTVRPGEPADVLLREAGLERLTLSPLAEADAISLLRRERPRLPPAAVARVLREADGNPLALIEFAEGAELGGTGERLPTTRRLEEAFLAGAEALPAGARRLLLLLAVSGEATMGEETDVSDVTAIEASGLATVVGDRLRFRHPLVGSAVYGAATSAQRRAAHRAVAASTRSVEKAAWHRAQATVDHDEAVAAELAAAAELANRRGARQEAVAWLRRAAAISPQDDRRVRRLAMAAEIAREAGLADESEELLRQATPEAREPDVVALLASAETLLTVTTGRPGLTVEEKIAQADRLAGPDGHANVLERSSILLGATARLWLVTGAPAAAPGLPEAIAALQEPGDNWIQLLAMGYADPVRAAPFLRGALPGLVRAAVTEWGPADVRPEADRLIATSRGRAGDPRWLFSVGLVAQAAQDLRTSRAAWDVALTGSRALGSAADESVTLSGRAITLFLQGDVAGALSDADQARRLAEEYRLWLVAGLGAGVLAAARAVRGEHGEAQAAIEDVRRYAVHAPCALAAALAHWAAGIVALNEGRAPDALHELRLVEVHPPTAAWSIADLAEAAARAGRPGEAGDMIARVAAAAQRLPGDYWAALVLRARAELDDDGAAGPAYEEALRTGRSGSPLEIAKTHLAYGTWLRRRRRIGPARDHLTRALAGLRTVGAAPLAGRAVTELRAAGARVDDAADDADGKAALLTPQELWVARLAATGMSNREIADQMFLSPRTVARHLFSAFPKLGIDQRTQLAAALGFPGATTRVSAPEGH